MAEDLPLQPLNPYAVDDTPAVTLEIGGKQYVSTYYEYVSDVLNLGDPFSCALPNPDGSLTGKVKKGDSVALYIADPGVDGGANKPVLKGLVTNLQMVGDLGKGEVIRVTGADLGWHLQNNTAPVWMNLRGITTQQLMNKLLDSSWGFSGIRSSNNLNKKLKLGRQGIQIAQSPDMIPEVLPRIQVEPGEMCADLLIRYARLQKALVNVSSDGYLQIWQPQYNGNPLYSIEYHKSTDPERKKNNVKNVTLTDSIDGVFTDVRCFSYQLMPYTMQSNNPNEGHFKGIYQNANALPFVHRTTFSDAEQLNRDQASARAKWKAQRGEFDSWTYEVTVYGHSQNGYLYAPDTMAKVNDTVHGVQGNYYVSAVRYSRNMQVGTTTTLTLKKPGLLAA